LIAQNLPQLTNLFFIIHQCGNPIATQDYQQQLLQARAQLPIEKQANYLVKPWVSQNELAWVYQHTDVVISRAGANSIAELASYELPAILIPLPKSSHQEQQANAEWYQAHFPAKILDQHQITAGQLLANLNELTKLERTKINLSTIRSNQEKVLADLYEMMKL
jgi:UDP-N-acetylglucosamine--N-acetylmuramyl-(pentapeptide) pyrophosphoryl-undecaprenol N-acetylglucosamine transferase